MKIYGTVHAIINTKTLKIYYPRKPIIGSISYCQKTLINLQHTKDLEIVKLDLQGPDEYELGRTDT